MKTKKTPEAIKEELLESILKLKAFQELPTDMWGGEKSKGLKRMYIFSKEVWRPFIENIQTGRFALWIWRLVILCK